ncbi:3-keto-5-aminohexanoate cleavage protein [Mesorhizobium loti]|uniref:3-keto-5-aminohexanoate cleavage protein n=1 Tax=Rhizobium loti TaxID=381 RepID=UPI003D7C28A8
MADQFGTRFEFEAYDGGHLYNLVHLLDRGLVKGRTFVQFVIGILGGSERMPTIVQAASTSPVFFLSILAGPSPIRGWRPSLPLLPRPADVGTILLAGQQRFFDIPDEPARD